MRLPTKQAEYAVPDAVTKSAYVALYPTDFLADVGHLGNTELGIYTRLLLVYYRDQRPLPFDTDRLRRLAMAFSPEECRALEAVLPEFFVLTAQPDGSRVWRHKRADRELEAAKQARERRVAQTEAARRARHSASDCSVTDSVTETVTGYSQRESQSQNQNQRNNTDSDARASVSPAGLAVVLRKVGVQCTGSHPTLIEMAQQGVSAETLLAAVAEAKRATGSSGFNVKYLAAIVARWASEAGSLNFTGAAPPAGRPASKGAAFLAALDRTVHDSGVADVAASAVGPARLGR